MRTLASLSLTSSALATGLAFTSSVFAADLTSIQMTSGESTYVAPATSGYLEFSAYGGYQTAPHSDVEVSEGPDFTAGWEGKSFSTPPYWGVRGSYWFGDGQLANLGVSLDFTHAKSMPTTRR